MPTHSLARAATTLLPFILTWVNWIVGVPINSLLSTVSCPSHLQFQETLSIEKPCCNLLTMDMMIKESPSTINGMFYFCKSHFIPLSNPSNSSILLVLVPIPPQKTLSILPFEFLMTPPNLACPGFPLVSPSNLILKDPSTGSCHVLELRGGEILVHSQELFPVIL